MLKKVQILIIGIALAIVPVAFAGAPYNLTGTYSGQSIILTWDNGTYSGITNLRIYKKSQYSDFAILATLPKTAVSYTNINVEPYTLYTFKIVTMGIDGSEKETSSSFEIGSMTNVTQYYDLIRFENNTASAGGTIKFHYSVPA